MSTQVIPMRPLRDGVLVRRIPEPAGTIIVPDAYREKSRRCKVVAVGPGKWDADHEVFTPTDVKPGEVVIVSPSINMDYGDVVEKDECVLIQEADILVVER